MDFIDQQRCVYICSELALIVGIVDLSCESGTIYIAFKYTGSGQSTFDGVYELDDISIDYETL